MDLVERDSALQTLRRQLQEATSRGQIALVAGEAGVGKTSLLRALSGTQEAVWWGACDALQTPHPLAPFLDIAREPGVRFAACLSGPRPALFGAVVDELSRAGGVAAPRLVVIEDAHWADEATLDLLKFLGRRIERTRSLLVITFRDDELAASHPLRSLIGDLPREALTRIDLCHPRVSTRWPDARCAHQLACSPRPAATRSS
jgi:predicted ATPase